MVGQLLGTTMRGRKPKLLGTVQNPTISTAARAVALNLIPKGTMFIGLTVATATVFLNFQDGAVLPTTAIGNAFPVGTYWLPFGSDILTKMWAYSATGTFHISFWGWD